MKGTIEGIVILFVVILAKKKKSLFVVVGMAIWPGQVDARDCGQVSVNLAPCLSYLQPEE